MAKMLYFNNNSQNIYFLLSSGKFCCLLITFANSLDPDEDQQKVGPDLDQNHLTLIVILK